MVYTGLYIKRGKRGNTAVIQIKEDKDCLSCELVEYYGERSDDKAAIKKRFNENKKSLLEELKINWPKYNIKYVSIDC